MPLGDSEGRAPAALQWESVSVDLGSSPLFRQEGEYWTIAYDGVVFRLRDTKGLHCVAYLLRHPGEKIAATDLVTNSLASHLLSLPTDRERTRILAAKHIKAAIEKIAAHHASLGHHLSTCIKTGSACAYMPDPARPIAWSP
jgi:hypothetical protein